MSQEALGVLARPSVGALTEKGAVYVMSPKREASVALLRQAINRMPPQ